TAPMHEPLTGPLTTAFQAAVAGTGLTLEPAPLAVQSDAPGGALFSFDKYSSANLLISAVREDAIRDPHPKNRRLLLVPHANVTFLQNNGTAVTGLEVFVKGQRRTISAGRELKQKFAVVIASSTVESTRLALNSFPVNGMGANLMAHLRSNISVRIPRSALGLGAPSQLETGALLVRGKVPVSGGQFRDFHLQVLAASSLKGAPDAILFSQIPDLDLLGQMTQNQSASEVR